MLNHSRTTTNDHNPASSLTWTALGAGLMYLLDPNLGKRRRHLLRDKLVSYARKTRDCTDATFRDVYHRAVGLAHETRASFSHEDVPDPVLVERVRSRLGRVVSHPHSVQICAGNGIVYVAGTVLQGEADNLLRTVKSTRGVRDLVFSLDVRPDSGHVPELQGGTPRAGTRNAFLRENWSPTARLLSGAFGATAGLYGVTRGGPLGVVAGILGMGMFVRATTNMETRKLVGLTQSRRGIDIQKVITINAPVEEVWSFWSNYDNFPLWMRNVKQVSQNPQTHLSRWVVAGPAGIPFQWDAAETERIENEVLAWKSVPGSTVANTGVVRFHRNDDDTTRVEIHLSYNPPAGAIGHAIASLFNSDPKTEMDEDLARMKTLIETANFPRDASRHLGVEQPT